MKTVFARVSNPLLAYEIQGVLRKNPDYLPTVADNPESFAARLQNELPDFFVLEVADKPPFDGASIRALCETLRQNCLQGKRLLVCNDKKYPSAAKETAQLKKDGLADCFVFYGRERWSYESGIAFPASYFVALLDTV